MLEKINTLIVRAAAELSQHRVCAMLADRVGDGLEKEPEDTPVETFCLHPVQDIEVLV